MDPAIELLNSLYDIPNCGSLYMFLYNLKSGVPMSVGETSRADITPIMNASADTNGGYELDTDTIEFARSAMRSLENITLPDLGITMIMMLFARYYAHNQYAIMINTLRGIAEIEFLEVYLKQHPGPTEPMRSASLNDDALNSLVRKHLETKSASNTEDPLSPILTSNMATDEKYGLSANADRFVGSLALKLEEFRFIVNAMKSKTLQANNFLRLIEGFHVRIVESFYILVSVTKDSKVIDQCRELCVPRMKYKFSRPVRSAVYTGDYWFVVPTRSVWFAYHQGRRTYQTYISRDADRLIDSTLRYVTSGVLVGFIHNGIIYPVIMDTPECNGNWPKTFGEFAKYGLPIIFRDNRAVAPPLEISALNKCLFFVKRDTNVLYKYIKN